MAAALAPSRAKSRGPILILGPMRIRNIAGFWVGSLITCGMLMTSVTSGCANRPFRSAHCGRNPSPMEFVEDRGEVTGYSAENGDPRGIGADIKLFGDPITEPGEFFAIRLPKQAARTASRRGPCGPSGAGLRITT